MRVRTGAQASFRARVRVRTQAPKRPSATSAVDGPTGVGPGGTCPPEPCFGFCEVPGCPLPTHRGKRGLKEEPERAFCGEALTSRSPSLAHLEVHIRSASPGQWPEVSGRVELCFPWPHSQELSSCGTLPPSLWGQVTVARGPFSLPGAPVRGQGGGTLAAWPPSAGETPRLGAQEAPGVQGPPDGLPLTVEWVPGAGGSPVTGPQMGSPGAR